MLNKKFDFIVSIGEDCACAMYLNKFLLRTRSYPFDWLCNASFETRINLILNDFNGFLEQCNMRWFPKPQTGLRDMENENYEDTATSFYFYHDFRSDTDFETMFPIVQEKYNRRIKRFYNAINNSKKVLFVWWSRDKLIPNETLIKTQQELSKKFNKKIYLLIFEHLPNTELCIKPVTEYITIASGHLTVPENTTMGNIKLCDSVFTSLRRTGTKKLKIIKILCGIIPFRALRRKIRTFVIHCCQKY